MPEAGIFSVFLAEQRLMRAVLDDAARREHQNFITEAARGQPVADIERRLAAGDRIELPVDLIFGNGVKRRRRLVEHEEGRILVKCAGDGDLLRLAAGQLNAVRLVILFYRNDVVVNRLTAVYKVYIKI